jgi:hypothetical protein
MRLPTRFLRSLRFLLICISPLVQAGIATAASIPPSLTVEVRNAAGASLASQADPQKVALTYGSAYQPGDAIVISAPPQDKYLFVKVDERVPEAMVYSPTAQVKFPIPLGPLSIGYDPLAFTGTNHRIEARAATLAEITEYRNVAMNSLDQRNVSEYFPHAIASSVTRDDPMFFERNAIDGNTRNNHHGKWPYESWGNGKYPNPWLKIDFGRDVTVDKVRLYIRADFPHDTYWTNMTIQFSDGSSKDITLQKTADPQDYTFPEKTVRWIQLTNFKQPTQPLGWAAVTEVEVYGKDVAAPQP